jgi:hypothetical protein
VLLEVWGEDEGGVGFFDSIEVFAGEAGVVGVEDVAVGCHRCWWLEGYVLYSSARVGNRCRARIYANHNWKRCGVVFFSLPKCLLCTATPTRYLTVLQVTTMSASMIALPETSSCWKNGLHIWKLRHSPNGVA